MDEKLIYTAHDAKVHLGALVDQALTGTPVTITRHGRPIVYVIAKQDYERLQNRILELRNQLES